MFRTMIRNSAVWVLAAGLLGGCAGEYERRDLGPDSPQGRQVRKMIDALRQAGDAFDAEAARQSADGLTESQAAGLKYLLRQIAQAERVELASLDRFGERVYRAALDLAGPQGPRKLHVLLVEVADGQLRWAGAN